jgi:hypothetical protein
MNPPLQSPLFLSKCFLLQNAACCFPFAQNHNREKSCRLDFLDERQLTPQRMERYNKINCRNVYDAMKCKKKSITASARKSQKLLKIRNYKKLGSQSDVYVWPVRPTQHAYFLGREFFSTFSASILIKKTRAVFDLH